MSQPSTRTFEVSASQYQLFRFTVGRPATVHLRMIATAPVNLILLSSEDRAQYEQMGTQTHPYAASWGRKSELEAAVKIDAGTWYLVVEGSTEPSRGRLDISSSGPRIGA